MVLFIRITVHQGENWVLIRQTIMTKITDFEANLEQYKIYQAAINSEAAEQRALLQATIEKNKVDADRQFAEIMNAIKTLQSAATAAATIPPPHHTQPYSHHTMPLQQPYTTTTTVMEKSGEYNGDVLIAEVEDEIQNFGYNEKTDKNESTRSNIEEIRNKRDEVLAAYDENRGLNSFVLVGVKHKHGDGMIHEALHHHYWVSFDDLPDVSLTSIELGGFYHSRLDQLNNHGLKSISIRTLWDPGIIQGDYATP